MVLSPPQHGKSEHVSRRLPAMIFGRRPNAKVLGCSYTADLAYTMSRDVQKIMATDAYKVLFPDTRLGSGRRVGDEPPPLRTQEEFEIVDGGGRITGGYYKAAGVRGGISGRTCDIGIIDDPFKGREEAESPTIREKTWAWFNGDFMTRLHKDSQVLVTMTPWHPDDLRGRLLKLQEEDPKADKWTVLKLPAVCEDPTADYEWRQAGEALWPERHSLESLAAKKAASIYDWNSLYRLDPSSPGGVEWPAEFFGPEIWFDDWPAGLDARVIALDPSKGRTDKSGDFSAFVMMGMDKEGMIWVDADMDNTRIVEPMESDPHRKTIATDAIRLYQEFRPHAFIYESNGFQEYVGHAIIRLAISRGITIPLYAYNNTDNKHARIRTLGALFAQRRIRVRKTKGGALLVSQLKEFPTGLHDDGPDALKLAELMMGWLLGVGEGKAPILLRV